jgi:WD40 repeat protein
MQPEQQNHPIYSIAWSPDGKQLLSASNDRSLKLWDAAGGTLVREFKPFNAKDFPKGHQDQVFCGVFSKDGKLIASGSHDGTIKLWNAADGTVVREFSNPKLKQPAPPESPLAHPGGVYGVQFTADGKHLISVGVAPKLRGYLAAWDTSDGRLLYGEVQSSAPIYSVAITKDGTRLLLGCGSPDRMTPASDALIVPMPIK